MEKPRMDRTKIIKGYATRSQEENRLYRWLLSWIDRDRVRKYWRTYGIGTDDIGRTVFPLLRLDSSIVDAKHVPYGTDGHRAKEGFTWTSSLPEYRDRWDKRPEEIGFFGLHLLRRYPDRIVNVVESEKTALLCAIYYPDSLWIAIGGASQLGLKRLSERAIVLRGRKVLLWPDVGQFNRWDNVARLLREEDYNAKCIRWIDEESVSRGYDPGDYVYADRLSSGAVTEAPTREIERETEEEERPRVDPDLESLASVVADNPVVGKLVDRLSLRLVGSEDREIDLERNVEETTPTEAPEEIPDGGPARVNPWSDTPEIEYNENEVPF